MSAIYIHGCSCGVNNVYVQRVKKHLPNTPVYNTKVDVQALINQLEYQDHAGMGKSPLSIVVEGDGEVVTPLKEWKP